MSYTDEAAKASSEKILLAQVEPSEQLVLWTLVSGSTYKRDVVHYVINAKQDDTTLTEASSSTLSSGEWFFDFATEELFVRMTDDTNPQTKFISVFYRLFFSNRPVDQTHDLSDAGDVVHYEPLIQTISGFKQDIDEEATGIAVETSSNIGFFNNGGFFDGLYDTLIFENKTISIFSWFPNLDFSDNQKLFQGTIKNKSYSGTNVKFSIQDRLFKLRESLPLTLYNGSDDVSQDRIGTPKRRVYGQVENLLTTAIDGVFDGFSLTGTLSVGVSSATITGVGTDFLDELNPEDVIFVNITSEVLEIKVKSIESDTSFTSTEDIGNSFSGLTGTNKPAINYRRKNRSWDISGHKLRAPQATVLLGIQANRFTVDDVTDLDDFFVNDLVQINGEQATIKRISGDLVVLLNNLQSGIPSVSDTMDKIPVSKVFFTQDINKGTSLIFTRDWTLTNTLTGSTIVFNNLAEFNITKQVLLGGSLTFTASSRIVTATGIDFIAQEIKPRDWIKLGLSDDPTHQVFYEVLQIDSETQLTIRIPFGGSTQVATATDIKRVEYIGDEAQITCNTLGRENAAGNWVKTASDAVKDILEDAGLSSSLNTASFVDADINAPYILSLSLPLNISSESPTTRDVINLINDSVFGSLTNDSSFDLFYRILTPEKPTTTLNIDDFDVVGKDSFKVRSVSNIFKKVNAFFNFFDADKFTKESGSSVFEFTSDFVTRLVESTEEKDIDVYLFNQADAKVIAQRFSFFHSLSTSTVTITGKLELSDVSLGDKIFIEFDRLYERFGQNSRQKMGTVIGINRTGENITLKINDLGNIFNRTGNITTNTDDVFSSASNDQKLFNGYIVDNSTALPDNSTEEAKGINLIG